MFEDVYPNYFTINWTNALNLSNPDIACVWVLFIGALAVILYIFISTYLYRKNPKPEVKEEPVKKRGKRK